MNKIACLVTAGTLVAGAACRAEPVRDCLGADIRDKVYVWGYVLDKTPSACPFVFGKTTVSLENAVSTFGAGKAMYMNSMFDRDYILKHFPKWDRECFENCIDTKLSERHWELMQDVPEVWCALQHGDKLGSAKRIAALSLRHPNIRGVNIDDFKDGNPANDMTPEELMGIRRAIQAINPGLKLAIVTYADADRLFDLAPYRDAIDLVSRWKWTADGAFWDQYDESIAKVRAQVGPRVKIVQGLYLHDFGAGMESRNPVPLEYFKRTVRKACSSVVGGTLDGIILPQVGWYSSPAHQAHVAWLKGYLACDRQWLQKAVDAKAAQGGGRVVVPAGEHLFAPVTLKSGVELHLEKGAVLKASTNLADYVARDGSPYLVGAFDATNVAVTGEGVIDGNGAAFKDKEGRAGESQPLAAPVLMRFSRCRDVRLEGFTYRQSGAWGLHLRNSDGVVVRRVTCFNHINECNDGIDIESRNVLIEDCDLDTDDDALVFKSESDPSFAITNVTVRNCRLASCCNFIKFGTGSYGLWRDILVEKCRLRRAGASWRFDWRKKIPGVTERITGLAGIALEVVDGGRMENVTVRDISWTEGVQTPVFIRLDRRHEPKAGAETCFRNVLVENVRGTAESRIACSATGVPGRELSGVTLRNVDLTFPGGGTEQEAKAEVPESVGEYPDPYMFGYGALPAWGFYLRHAPGVKLENVELRLRPGASDAREKIVNLK